MRSIILEKIKLHHNYFQFKGSCLWVFSISLILACNNSKSRYPPQPDVSKVKVGMSYIEVLEVAGLSTEKINVGTVTDQFNHQTQTEEWYYGNNQLIVIVNDTVESVDRDVASTYRKIQYIIDSAKAAGDTRPMIAPGN